VTISETYEFLESIRRTEAEIIKILELARILTNAGYGHIRIGRVKE